MEAKRVIGISIPFELLKEKYLERVLAEGIHVEITLKAEILDSVDRASFRDVSKLLRERGLRPTVHLPFMDLSLAGFDPWIRKVSLKRLFQGMEIASLFEPLLCVFHSGYHPDYHREARQSWREVFIEVSLPEILSRGKDLGLKLALENTFEPDPQFMAPIFDTFSETLGWCFDPAHARVFSESEEIEWLRVLYTHLKEIHCHDNLGKWDDHLALGDGVIDFKSIFSFLANNSLQPIFTIEAKREEDALKSLSYIQKLLGC